jgi:hypothetical protein
LQQTFLAMPSDAARNIIKIDVVAYKDHDDNWIAQGIQYDIVAHARSPGGLREAFTRQLAANLALNTHLGRQKLEGIPPAPNRFKVWFDEAREKLTPLTPSPTPSRSIREEIDIRLAETV